METTEKSHKISNMDENKVILTDLAPQTTEPQVQDYMLRFGPIWCVELNKKKDPGSPVSGFVIFAKQESAQKVLSTCHMLNGKQVNTKKLVSLNFFKFWFLA